MLALAGLWHGSFVPPAKLRELRLIARQRQKLVGQLASEKNRLHKVLTDSSIRLGVMASANRPVPRSRPSSRGAALHEVLQLASRRLLAQNPAGRRSHRRGHAAGGNR
jgi:transposase